MNFKDYYFTLGVARDADAADIKRAYRKLAREHHPDRASPGTRKAAEEKIKEINEAYEVLKDPEKRRKYDRLGANWDREEPGGGWSDQSWAQGDIFSGARRRRRPSGVHFGGTGFSDFFEEFFGEGGGMRFSDGPEFTSARGSTRAGQHLEADLMVSLEEAARGGVRSISLRRADPETGVEESSPLKVRIPAGVREGQRLRVSGRGGAGIAGGPPGDLYLRVHLAPHPDFRVKDRDLHYDLDLAPWEAVLGAKVEIPTLAGVVRLTVNPGTRSGRQLRVRGRGLPGTKGEPAGDLIVEVAIQVPETITPAERELWQKLAEISAFRPRE